VSLSAKMGDMILPKGIVTNTSWIYDEVAKYPVVPPDQIHKYWRVYTTTFTRLVDPTANRLENFWWHVWGSELRHLPGPVLARMFEQISNGPTFVRLRSTANRYEGPSLPSSPDSKKATAPETPSQTESATATFEPVAGDGSPDVDNRSAVPTTKKGSAQQQQPGKPILKPPRAGSTTGPRPVARFVSPAVSDSEDLASSDGTAVNEQANPKHVDLLKPKPADKKRVAAVTPKKKGPKVVASTARRRPAMPRRPSSQSSAGGSDNGSKESGSVSSSKVSSSARSIGTIEEDGSIRPTTQTLEDDEPLSTKAAGKQPSRDLNTNQPTQAAVQTSAVLPRKAVAAISPAPSSQQILATSVPTTSTGETSKIAPQPSARARNVSFEGQITSGMRPSLSGGAVLMNRSRSDMGVQRPGIRDFSMNKRGISQSLLSSTTVTTSTATAQGTIIEFDENLPAHEAIRHAFNADDDLLPGLQRSSTGSSTSSRLVPTLPSGSPNVPLGRSKSQLTLLLERQGDDKKTRR